jgi:hypothetical protein
VVTAVLAYAARSAGCLVAKWLVRHWAPEVCLRWRWDGRFAAFGPIRALAWC